jgi:hypothetical protein
LISNAACWRIDQAQFAISSTEQHDCGITGHAGAVKAPLHNAPTKSAKFDLACLSFFATVWHWQSSVGIGLRYQ